MTNGAAHPEVDACTILANARLDAIEHALVPVACTRVQLYICTRRARVGSEGRDADKRVRREAQLLRVRAELERVVGDVCRRHHALPGPV
jgi:hypothetical protein